MKKVKIIQPIQPETFENKVNTAEIIFKSSAGEEKISAYFFENILEEEKDLSKLIFSGVKFLNCRFWNCRFDKTEFTDVVFQGCDFSGSDMRDTYYERVEFQNCKGVGTKFYNSTLKHTVISGGKMDYAVFDASKLEKVRISDTELKSSNLNECKFKNVEWSCVNLMGAGFFKTPLRGMDFSDSNISGIIISDHHRELEGAVVDMYQAVELSKRLGIIIKDLEDV